MNKPIFRSAITDEAGDVDVGYLALIWGVIGWSTAVAVILLIGVFVAWREPTTGAATIQSIGVAIGAASGGFATMLGAVGFFRFGDSRRPVGTTETISSQKTVTKASPSPAAIPAAKGEPIPVAVVDMPAPTAPPIRATKAKK